MGGGIYVYSGDTCRSENELMQLWLVSEPDCLVGRSVRVMCQLSLTSIGNGLGCVKVTNTASRVTAARTKLALLAVLVLPYH